MTLQFSARQNVITALIANPAYSNVFLGRIGALLKNNNLGKPDNIGEKVTIATQSHLNKLKTEGHSGTKLIAASIRNWSQLLLLKSINIYTIPVKVANEAEVNINKFDPVPFKNINKIEYFDGIDPDEWHMNDLWSVSDNILKLAQSRTNNLPQSGDELEEIFRNNGYEDIFPKLSKEELNTINKDGKIPVLKHWEKKVKEKKTGIDTLLNMAGLYSFKADQQALDNRIKIKLGIEL